MTIAFLDDRRLRSGLVSVDRVTRLHAQKHGLEHANPNPYIDPDFLQNVLEEHRKSVKLDATFGSYGENRAFVWRGTYLDAMEDPIHMGVDVNVPAESLVVADTDCTVVWLGTDHPELHGWGNRIIAKLHGVDIWMIYAHLGNKLRCKLNQRLGPDDPIGVVGTPAENGGWYPHLYVQAMTHEAWEMFQEDPSSIDGYCPAKEWPQKEKLFPLPWKYISIP